MLRHHISDTSYHEFGKLLKPSKSFIALLREISNMLSLAVKLPDFSRGYLIKNNIFMN